MVKTWENVYPKWAISIDQLSVVLIVMSHCIKCFPAQQFFDFQRTMTEAECPARSAVHVQCPTVGALNVHCTPTALRAGLVKTACL